LATLARVEVVAKGAGCAGRTSGRGHCSATWISRIGCRPGIRCGAARAIVNQALNALSGDFDRAYGRIGRPGVPPEKLLRALLLQAFYYRFFCPARAALAVPSQRRVLCCTSAWPSS
jgi:hypothetical protein